MKRYLSVILLFLFLSLSAFGGRDVPVAVRTSVVGGSILRGSVIEPLIGNRPVLGAEVAVEFLPTGRWRCLTDYNNASVGVAVDYLNLTNDKMLGQAFAPYAYLNIPFVRRKHFLFGVRAGIGAAIVTKTYYNTADSHPLFMKSLRDGDGYPIGNAGSGSHLNAYFAEALYMEFPISHGFAITASYGWYHISNGSIKQPNSGFNMFNGMLSLTYQPHYDTYQAPETTVPKGLYSDKRWDVELSATGGVRQAYYQDNRYFGVASVSVAAHYRPWSIFKIGGGVDMFYDGYYRSVNETPTTDGPVTAYKKTYLRESRIENCFRVGVSVQPEFVVGNLSVGFHLGVYIYDNIKNLEPYQKARENGGLHKGVFYAYDILNAGDNEDGWLYTRIVLKYRVTKHLFVQAGMKAHIFRAEFIDAGLGLAF